MIGGNPFFCSVVKVSVFARFHEICGWMLNVIEILHKTLDRRERDERGVLRNTGVGS